MLRNGDFSQDLPQSKLNIFKSIPLLTRRVTFINLHSVGFFGLVHTLTVKKKEAPL